MRSAFYPNELFLNEEIGKHKLIKALQSLVPDYEHPEELDNLENKTQPELIELLITAAKYWREQGEN